MPAVVPLVAAVAGAAASAAIGAVPLGLLAGGAFVGLGLSSATLGAIAGGLTAFSINALGSRAVAKKPKSSGGGSLDAGIKQVVRQSDATQRIIYGRARVGGVLVHAATTSSGPNQQGATVTGTNKFLHLVVAIAGHEVEEIGDIYFNDEIISLDPSGWSNAAPYSASTTTTTDIVKDIPTARRDTNIVTVTTSTAHGFSAGGSVRIAGLGDYTMNGSFSIKDTPDATTFTYIARGPNGTAHGGTARRSISTTTANGYVRVRKFTGSDDQAASPELVAEVPGWTADHRLRGIAYIHVRLEYTADAFPTGIPTINAIVKGKKPYDPRTGLSEWSENPALCIRDYLTSRDGGNLPYGFGVSTSEIDDDYTVAAANICEEAVTLADGTSQYRYTCNGVIDTANAPTDNLQGLVTSLAGAVTCPKGMFRIHAGAYDTPETTVIDESWLTGNIKSRNRIPRQELFNAVRGTYVSEASDWQPTDFPPVTSALYEAEDNGERIYTDIEMPFTTESAMAQRIAKIIQRKGREQITVTMPLNYKALRFAVWDTVKINNTKRGWSEKVFRIENFSYDFRAGIVLQLKEENALSYDWSATDQQAEDAAPDTNLPSATTVEPPNALTVTEAKYVTRDGTAVKALAELTWLASPDAFLRQYQAEYRLTTDAAWKLLPPTIDTTAEVLDIAPGAYDFRVKAVNTLGVSSAYATTSIQITGLLDAPTEPQNLTISTIGGFAMLRWDPTQDTDVRIGGHFEFRHSPDTGVTWNQTTTISNAVPGAHASVALPLKPGSYLVKAIDSSGIQSTDFAMVTTSQATALAYANVTSLTEHSAFTGSMSGVVLDTGVLKLSGSGTFDGIPDFDAVPDLDAYGGTTVEGTYDFSGAMDLGSVSHIRLTSHVLAEITQIYDKLDSRSAPMDDWTTFDGDVAAAGDAIVYVRDTDDDPAGTPTWRDWQRLDSGEFYARAFQFKLVMHVTDSTYNVSVSELSVTADEVV